MNTSMEILSAFIYFNVNIFWKFVVWTVSLITLPIRALAALRREKQLQAQISELQDSLDSLVWDRKELQEHIRIAVKEHEMMEMMLGELEEEHTEAIHKIKLLESTLHDLNGENLRLKEVYGKSQSDTDAKVDGISPWKNNDVSLMRQIVGSIVYSGNIKEVALSQSLFSAMLSAVVGMVVWAAEEPCMPLVMALFMVVGMSLKSVVRLLSTVKNKPAFDAVALMSLNWFILGTLAYPMLPRVGHISARLLNESLGRTFGW